MLEEQVVYLGAALCNIDDMFEISAIMLQVINKTKNNIKKWKKNLKPT